MNAVSITDRTHKPLFTVANVSFNQKDYAYLYRYDDMFLEINNEKRKACKKISDKLNKLFSKRLKLDININYWRFKFDDVKSRGWV